MVTPALTKQQIKQTLSAKKGPKVLRNVLSVPYETYWPLLQGEDHGLICMLESMLAVLKMPKNPSYHQMKNLSWKEVKELKKVIRVLPPEKKALRDMLVFGSKCVAKALEKDNLCCVLVGSDLVPKEHTRYLTVMCANHRVPLLLIPKLSKIVENSAGISTIALGFKNCVAENNDNPYHDLFLKIKELSAKFPINEPSTFFSAICEKVCRVQDEMEDKKKVVSEPARAPSSLYLKRSSTNERAFVPCQGDDSKKPLSGTDFLALNSSFSDVDDIEGNLEELSKPVGISFSWCQTSLEETQKPQYIHPVIKRLQPNPNKKRKKRKNKNQIGE